MQKFVESSMGENRQGHSVITTGDYLFVRGWVFAIYKSFDDAFQVLHKSSQTGNIDTTDGVTSVLQARTVDLNFLFRIRPNCLRLQCTEI